MGKQGTDQPLLQQATSSYESRLYVLHFSVVVGCG